MNKEKSTERRQSGGTMPKQLYGICRVQNHAFLSPDGGRAFADFPMRKKKEIFLGGLV
jgi:hypothetical protein